MASWMTKQQIDFTIMVRQIPRHSTLKIYLCRELNSWNTFMSDGISIHCAIFMEGNRIRETAFVRLCSSAHNLSNQASQIDIGIPSLAFQRTSFTNSYLSSRPTTTFLATLKTPLHSSIVLLSTLMTRSFRWNISGWEK